MGRRSRAREREAAAAAARPEVGVPAPARQRRNWARLLNPFKFRELTRSRARGGAIGFGLSALLCTVLGWVFDDVAWYSSAVLLAVLAMAWGVATALLTGGDRSS